jgi:DNA mismatch repair ATPase MutS
MLSNDIFIKGGRHPVVDVNLLASGRQFTRNDCHLSDDTGRIWLITGQVYFFE